MILANTAVAILPALSDLTGGQLALLVIVMLVGARRMGLISMGRQNNQNNNNQNSRGQGGGYNNRRF